MPFAFAYEEEILIGPSKLLAGPSADGDEPAGPRRLLNNVGRRSSLDKNDLGAVDHFGEIGGGDDFVHALDQ